MAKGKKAEPITDMRRHDRARDDDWIRVFLEAGAWGGLATTQDGQPFINSNLYVYDEGQHVIYMHTARQGRTRSNVEVGEPACFSVSSMGRILPADTALEFSVEYAGVAVFGRAKVVEDDDEKRSALQMLLDKYAPHLQPERDYALPDQNDLDRTSVFRIDIDSWSGKKKEESEDFPGAFHYPAQ